MSPYLLVAGLLLPCLSPALPPTPPVPFTMEVLPARTVEAIPGQHCVLLVVVRNGNAPEGWPAGVHVSATAKGASLAVRPELVLPGMVAEVTVIPDPPVVTGPGAQYEGPEWIITVNITGTRAEQTQTVAVPITVIPEDGAGVEEDAAAVRDLFIPWLAENYPELGITPDTVWVGTMVSPRIWVVTHYLFYCPEWELHVCWHVMIPPYDWARIELRHRFVEPCPSLAFQIASRSAAPPLEVFPVAPNPFAWR